MQRFISVLIIGLMLSTAIQPAIKILHFYKNQAEIIATHCINKNKPKLHCEGHCYLTKQLTEDREQSDHSSVPEISIFIPVAAMCYYEFNLLKLDYEVKEKTFYLAFTKVKSFHGDIFTPPKSIS